MIKKYTFFGSGTIEFEDSKSVKELIQYAFDAFDYYEPAGMEVVTIFQCHHSKTNVGWFTTDTDRSCADEIENADELCFAYYLLNTFYYAEGGWGHHMIELGNHPYIPNPVALKIRFEDFDNTVVINGNYCFNDVISYLIKTEYVSSDCNQILVNPVGIPNGPYTLSLSDKIMKEKLTDFEKHLEERTKEYYSRADYIYHVIIEFE